MQEGKERVKRNQLSYKEMFALSPLVAAEYVSSDKTDAEFAVLATERLGFPVSEGNVKAARELHDIPSRRERRLSEASSEDANSSAEVAALKRRIEALESRCVGLEGKIAVLVAFAQKAGGTTDLSGLQFHLGG